MRDQAVLSQHTSTRTVALNDPISSRGMMNRDRYPIPAEFQQRAHITEQQYHDMYRRSIEDPEGFWAEQAESFVSWSGRWTKVLDGDFTKGSVRWFEGGRLNACYNCVDRHLATRGGQPAIIWEGNEPGESRSITYRELHEQVCRLANVLKNQGVGKGDRVCLYMPMVPEAVMAMLACARIGAIHSVVFAGFSSEAFKHRVLDSDCRLAITVDGYRHGNKTIAHKEKTDQALQGCTGVKTVLVVKRLGLDIPWDRSRDVWFHEAMAGASSECPVVVRLMGLRRASRRSGHKTPLPLCEGVWINHQELLYQQMGSLSSAQAAQRATAQRATARHKTQAR